MASLARFHGPGGRSSASGLTVSVFGNSGFVGRYVVNSFGRIGSSVIVPYRGEQKKIDHLKVMGDVGQIVPVPYDPRMSQSIDRAVKNANIVINLVGKHYPTRNFSIADAHVGVAGAVATACARSELKPRLIHVSRYGASPDSPCEQLKAKFAGEQAVKEAYPEATILRPTIMFGDEDRFFNVYGTMMRFWPFVALIHGENKIAPLSVFNLAEACLACVNKKDTKGKIFELGGPNVYTRKEAIEVLAKITRLEPTVIDVPDRIAPILGRILSIFRTPLLSEDEVALKASQDDVPDGSLPGLADLGIEPLTIEDLGINTLRKFRKPLTYYEVFEQGREHSN